MTKVSLTRLLGGLLAALILAVSVGAAKAAPAAPQPYVVLVGISKYEDKQIKPRPHAEDDVKALYKLLTSDKYLHGIDADHARLLLGDPEGVKGAQAATRANILAALKWVAKNARSEDPVIFVFIGEGGPLGKTGDHRCYFAVDSTYKGRDKDAVTADEIGDILKHLDSHRFSAFLDVDFKGFTGDAQAVAEPTLGQAPYAEFLGDDGTEEHTPKRGRALFLATNGLSTSLDLKEHGLFTDVILKGLEGAADKEGDEADGAITVDELARYLSKNIPSEARAHGKTKEEKQQTNFTLRGHGSHFVLTANPQAAAKNQKRLDAFEEMVKKGKVPEDLAAEGRELLERMPRLKYRRSLRKEYQDLVDGEITLAQLKDKRKNLLDSAVISGADSRKFASEVLDAIDKVREDFIEEVSRGKMVTWAVEELYDWVEEKIPDAIQKRLKNVSDLTRSDLEDLLADARKDLGTREDLPRTRALDVALQQMLKHLDKYTTYIDEETLARWKIDVEGQFTGIGIQIRKDSATDQLLVVTPIRNSPAHRAGIKTGDIITKVLRDVDSNGKPLDPPEVIETKGLPLSDAVKKILGKRGTKVKLFVKREGEDQPLEFTITRAPIEVESVMGFKRKKNADWDFMIDHDNKIGYIRLTNFARGSYRDLLGAMEDLTRQGVKGFIFDLRFNPGGLLTSAIQISDLFINDGVIVSIRPRVGRGKTYKGDAEGSLLDFPMVCLINGQSASGSEIVSACLQDNHRALLIGERSYGKGRVQNIQPFGKGELKMTTATFWRPSNKNLDKLSTKGREQDEWGVTPDRVIKLPRSEMGTLYDHLHDAEVIRSGASKEPKKTEFKDRQLDEALKYLRGQIKTAARGSSERKEG